MKASTRFLGRIALLLAPVIVMGCSRGDETSRATAVPPTPTVLAQPTPVTAASGADRDFIVIATDAPNPNFTDFDKFGNIIGFNSDLMARLAAIADFEYEFVVTPHEGVLESIAAQTNTDFDAVMSSLVIPDFPREGIVYSEPYLEIGQVLMVLADERLLQNPGDIQPGVLIGVEVNSSGEQAARDILGLAEADIRDFETSGQALQALIDGLVDAVILDSHIAEHFAQAFPEQLKIAGGEGRSSWIASKRYGIALSAENVDLLTRLNGAIEQARSDLTIDRLKVAWLIPEEPINAGESRVPTPASELIVGVVGQPSDMDPASDPGLVDWELKINTMSGLFAVDSNNQLVPMLATGLPSVSEDKLEYTFSLRQGVRFPDGSELTADDVKWSINRAAGLGSFLINETLKDSDEDNFADEDAVQAIDRYTVRIILQEPTAHFLSLLATPPYSPVSDECYAETWDLASTCGGIGPYTIVSWDADRIQLKANPEWPGRPAPAFENVHVRFFEDFASMRRSLVEFQSIDIAWTGIPYADLVDLRVMDANVDGAADFLAWEGASIFKSYLIFDQATPPWNSKNIRQAVAYAVDRQALSDEVFGGSRKPLYSPIPDQVPGYVKALPERNLGSAQALLTEEGYSQTRPLEITLWYTNDAHYTVLEEAYAIALKDQLEETGIFTVTLASAAWETYRPQVGQCGYPLYLLGWPTPGQPPSYMDVTSWTDFFVKNTSSGFCSNYESEEMSELVSAATETLDVTERLALYAQIQQLWADELPTLDLTQEPRWAISLPGVSNVRIDAMGMLHYEVLTKGGG